MKKRRILIVGGVAVLLLTAFSLMGWSYHDRPQFCGLCHMMDPYLESWESSDWLARTHAEEDIACLDCHEATIQQQVQELYLTVTNQYSVPLRERQFPMEMCVECHEDGSYEASLTAAGQEVNPHNTIDLANSNAPHESGQGRVECYNCHKMHRPSKELEYCYSVCHHERNWESCDSLGCHVEGSEDDWGSESE